MKAHVCRALEKSESWERKCMIPGIAPGVNFLRGVRRLVSSSYNIFELVPVGLYLV